MACFEFVYAVSLCRFHYVLLPDLLIRPFGQVIWGEPGSDISDWLITSPYDRQFTAHGIALPLASIAAAGDSGAPVGLSTVSAPDREWFQG